MSSMVTRKRKLAESPLSMVHKNGETLVVKSVVSGNRIFKESIGNGGDVSDDEHGADTGGMSDSELWMEEVAIDMGLEAPPEDPSLLPDCRVKRNYSCSQCSFFTQNPRKFLYHLRDDHAEKMKIYECKWCIYASKHSQKVQRHIRMCHGPDSSVEKNIKTRLSKSTPPESGVEAKLQQLLQEKKSSTKELNRHSAAVKGEASYESLSVHSLEGCDDQAEDQMEEDRDDLISNEEEKTESESAGDDGEDSAMAQSIQAEIDYDHGEDEDEEDDAKYESGFLPNDADTSAEESADGKISKRRSQRNKRRGSSAGGTTNGKKFFRCTTCNYVTNVKARFTKHVKYHSMPLIKCDYCDFKTPYKWNLDRHYKNHNGEGNLHCPLCNFTADIKQSLTVHVQNHHANVPANSINDMIKQQIQLAAASEIEKCGGITVAAGMEAPYLDDAGEIMSGDSVKKAKLKLAAGKGIKKEAQGSDRHDFNADFIHPDDILDKNGKIYIKKLKCKYCSYKAVWETEMNRHMTRTHGVILPKRRNSTNVSPTKPMPNLIPIQVPSIANNPGILSTLCAENKSLNVQHNDVSQLDSSISIKKETKCSDSQFSKNNARNHGGKEEKNEVGDEFSDKSMFLQSLALKPNVVYSLDNASESQGRNSTSGSRRTSCSSGGSSGGRRLSVCGVDSSVSIIPLLRPSQKPAATSTVVKPSVFYETLSQKLVSSKGDPAPLDMSKNTVTITSNSTRCQFCRQRCKTSADLLMHLSVCTIAKNDNEDSNDSGGSATTRSNYQNIKHENGNENEEEKHDSKLTNSSENKIFVWNKQFTMKEEEEDEENTFEERIDEDDDEDEDYALKGHFLEGEDEDLVGFETAPGIGAIHAGKLEELWGTAEYAPVSLLFNNSDDPESVTTTRKVYRCPQSNCGFWATTASRFHVHIVGHYNMKPFECSQCSYKSNWRWDITKHIKLKGMRDSAHQKAKVLLTHESGQRNYRKYDKHLQMMQLKHSADMKLPDCSTVASKRNNYETDGGSSSEVSAPQISPQTNGVTNGSNDQKLQMPKLTRAPLTQGGLSPASSCKSDEGSSRPPPPPVLKPISSSVPPSRTIVEKRMLSGGQILSMDEQGRCSPEVNNVVKAENGPPAKRARAGAGNKKALWKCKKCTFKHASKEIVVFHIRQYHKPKKGESVSILSKNNLTSISVDDDVEEELSEEDFSKKPIFAKETHQYVYSDEDNLFSCKFCPFTTQTIGSMEVHAENHFSKPNCNFSCAYCSYSVPTKQELLVHMQLHGVFEQENEASDQERMSTITIEETPPKPRGSSATGSPYKKYHCTECPYVTDSKGQFLYHKQFHRPRDTPFKCPQCSYNVSHKHLLHQHVRVHEKNGEIAGNTVIDDEPSDEAVVKVEPESSGRPACLAWSKGRPLRMYRCRVCPQVYGKINDLVEHETTHGLSPVNTPSVPASVPAPALSNHSQKQICNGNGNNNISITTTSVNNTTSEEKSALYLCGDCPARFFYEKELRIHHSFHTQQLAYRCRLCSYSARQEMPHLLSHMKVHGKEYQLKTEQLLLRYPKAPKLTFDSSISINVSTSSHNPTPSSSNGTTAYALQLQMLKGSIPSPIMCPKCPGKFNTSAAYQQHIAHHGVNSVYRCRYCDYSVDTLKNLTLHELLHAGSEITVSEPINLQKKPKAETTPVVNVPTVASMDDQFQDEAYIGNPDFTYPTYVKNGRVKSKRYKCIKCPSAFEKRDQYKVHMGLHGSSQRYKCAVCDYAVTYYANFIQHLKKHSTQPNINPELLIAKPFSKCKTDGSTPISNPQPSTSSSNNVTVTNEKVSKVSPAQKHLKCTKCQFTTLDKTVMDDHKLEHNLEAAVAKEKKGAHKCSFCEFACSRKNLLKDHVRLHFHVSPGDESSTAYTYIDDVNSYTGNRKIYNEKENYRDKQVKSEPVDNESISARRRKITPPVVKIETNEASETEVEEEQDDEGEENVKNGD